MRWTRGIRRRWLGVIHIGSPTTSAEPRVLRAAGCCLASAPAGLRWSVVHPELGFGRPAQDLRRRRRGPSRSSTNFWRKSACSARRGASREHSSRPRDVEMLRARGRFRRSRSRQPRERRWVRLRARCDMCPSDRASGRGRRCPGVASRHEGKRYSAGQAWGRESSIMNQLHKIGTRAVRSIA